ncbi:MAG TPA: MFS transporter [Patescibacteria group bacterium]|nr:MFS transporter [Patescibacteria group bacterium]
MQRFERNIKLFYVFNFFIGLLFSIPIWVAFEHRILTFGQMALFSAISTAIETFLQIPTGAIADMMGRKSALIIGWMTLAVLYLFEAYAKTPLQFFLIFAFAGAATSLSSGADVALVYDSLQAMKKEGMFSLVVAKAKFWYRISMAAATLIGGYLFLTNISFPYVGQAIAFLIGIILLFLMYEPTVSIKRSISITMYIRHMHQGFTELFKNSYMVKLTIFYSLIGAITWSCLNYYNLTFMSDIGFSTKELAVFFALAYIISAFVIYFLAKLPITLTREHIYLGFPLLMSLSLLPGVFANHVIAPLMLIVTQITGGARFTLLDRYANQEFSSRYRATANSALNMLVSICYIVLVTLGGQFQDTYGTKIIYTMLGVLTVLFVLPSSITLLISHRKGLSQMIAVKTAIVEENEQKEI